MSRSADSMRSFRFALPALAGFVFATAALGCGSDSPARADGNDDGAAGPTTSSGPSSNGQGAGPGGGADSAVEVSSEQAEGPHGLDGSARPELGRDARRLRIDALAAAMTRVAGTDVNGAPLQWKVNNVDGFSDAAFGKALGRPDYRNVTDENPTSSAMYLKLVGDAARDLCTQMAKNDQKRIDPATRTLFPKAAIDGTATEADVDANLRYLLLRFLGLRLASDHPMVTKLRGVYDAGVATSAEGSAIAPEAEGWRGVCVALYESPLFHND
jgi:hypothetical protein